MSNLEVEPDEVVCAEPHTGRRIELLAPREVPLGGPRALTVRRTLPQRSRSLIGAWCFLDHYGPDPVRHGNGMRVPPHPHTGLQTVSWLFAGEIEHRDSTGAHASVIPGEINLMTAGAGIQHSEVSTPEATTLHGAQLWIALPESARHHPPFFEHHSPAPVVVGSATVRVFVGELAGSSSPVTAFSALVGAQVNLPAGKSARLVVDATFEHGILNDSGSLLVEGEAVAPSHLAYLAPGRATITLTAGESEVRALIIGGVPLGERIVMWWNFIGRSHDEIVAFRERWQLDVIDEGDPAGMFGMVDGYDGPPLRAPELPTVRLKPRE